MQNPDAQQHGAPDRGRALDIARALRDAGYQAFFVGGCVRDELLGRPPKDYDIATDARPDDIRGIFPRSRLVGAQFGVMLVIEHAVEYQVSTFRQDGVYRDGRHPESVRFGTMAEDANRRDFTINSLYLDPFAEDTVDGGKVIDFVGGRDDLRSRLVRAIGVPAQRFAEDYLRMLRAVRFAVQLDFEIEAATWDALRENAPRIGGISVERVRDEVQLILTGRAPGEGIRKLDESGLLKVVLPEIDAMHGVTQPPEFHLGFDVFEHTCRALEALSRPDIVLSLAVLLHDVGKPVTRSIQPDKDGKPRIRFFQHDKVGARMARDILERLRFPRRVIDDVVLCIADHMRIKDAPRFRKATLRRLLARSTFPTELELHRADCAVTHRMMDAYDFLVEARDQYRDEAPVPPPLLTGRDLIEIGYSADRRLGRTLGHIQELHLEGALNTREEALDLARRGLSDPAFPPPPPQPAPGRDATREPS